MSKNYVVVLKATKSIKGQMIQEGTELGTVSIDALKGFEPENIVTQFEQGSIDLVDPEIHKKNKALKAKEDKKEA